MYSNRMCRDGMDQGSTGKGGHRGSGGKDAGNHICVFHIFIFVLNIFMFFWPTGGWVLMGGHGWRFRSNDGSSGEMVAKLAAPGCQALANVAAPERHLASLADTWPKWRTSAMVWPKWRLSASIVDLTEIPKKAAV